ncbi:glycosyltransferase [Sulfitobacter mediterraneus]|nr:glycosyltransferase [Sulfitobacter mediterraneus]MBM1567123.1 glycosyltransferase [Sulfitobacter mediterraneus]MBM1570925.1 glycosyltransferase [Sulfitobacter mediterraneus]MBM1574725.1 glycosyltransferase [Sulfitobacter mediterraneus]MBM1578282.1 glycosyltransferase [Sulfitobacter mediterraneus]
MAKSDTRPHVILIGGCGFCSGVPEHIRHIVKAIKDHACITIVSEPDRGGYTEVRALGAVHHSIPGLSSGLSPLRHLQAGRKLLRFLKGQPADLVWVHARLAVLICRIALMLRIWRPAHPVLFTFHGLPFGRGHRTVLRRCAAIAERCVLRFSPPLDLIFLGVQMRGSMISHLGNPIAGRHRLHVLTNCSDLRELTPAKRKSGFNIVMTGRACYQKDYDTAVRVFSALPDRFTLTLAGMDTQTPHFQQRIKARVPNATFERITFCGPVRDVRPLLGAADAFMLTSRYEGMPIGALEAFEMGLPLILKDFEGARELASNHPFALVTPFRDLASDRDRIAELLADYQKHLPSNRAAVQHAWAQSFSPPVFQRNLHQLFEDCGVSLCAIEAASDCTRDDPVRHQYRDKRSVFPAPTPPPCCTDGAPSAQSE